MKAIITISALSIALVLPATAAAETYTYDSRGRISHVVYDDGSEVDFEWDANGNLTRREVVAAAAIEPEPSGSPDDGCGCASSSTRPVSAVLFGGLALVVSLHRRRRI